MPGAPGANLSPRALFVYMSTEPNDEAPDVPPRHNGRVPDEPRAPWDHQRTPLARAFARAFDRFQAVAGDQADQLIATGQDRVFALSGLALDPHELSLYMEELVAGYTQVALEGDDRHAIAVMRGLAIHALVVGELHAADRISSERLHAAIEQTAADPRLLLRDRVLGQLVNEELVRIIRSLIEANETRDGAIELIRSQLGGGAAQLLAELLEEPDAAP